MRRTTSLLFICLTVPVAIDAGAAVSVEDEGTDAGELSPDIRMTRETAPRYRTREEMREAGQHRQLTEWFTLSSLFEVEVMRNSSVYHEADSNDLSLEDSLSLQLGMLFELSQEFSLETVAEYDSDENDFYTEEAYLTFEREPWELTLGKQYTPLGSYFSHFVSGPMVEFGETQAKKSIALIYGPDDDLDITLMGYQGNARSLDGDEWDWSAAIEIWPLEGVSAGLSYQSDLADADERPLREWDDRYRDPVAGVSGYLFFVNDSYEASFEYLTAVSPFAALPGDRDEPSAWNLELSRYLHGQDVEIALRVEQSSKLPEMPTRQYGISLTHYVDRQASFTLEFLRGVFGKQAVYEEDEEPPDRVDRFGARLTIGF